MPPKRKQVEGGPSTSARDRKKQKVAFARAIAVQSPQSASNFGRAGSKETNVNSLKGLPSAIDVERFAEARAFEVAAMETAMKSASASSTQRAWQVLPRHLRRRAASHDVRRVPVRLREKARFEMDPVSKKLVKKPKRGKANRANRTESLLRRQRDKVWLETHIWHAKRMHMQNLWGYSLAMNPTEKAFRPSHRASVHGSILHDYSYQGLIELKGPENAVRTILERCCDPQGPGPGAKRFITGARTLDTCIYELDIYPRGLIGPATILWKSLSRQPVVPAAHNIFVVEQQHTEIQSIDTRKKTKRNKGKAKTQDSSVTSNVISDTVIRTVWVWTHPAAFDASFATLQSTASYLLDQIRRSDSGAASIEIELSDLRDHLNVFEIIGPKSNQVIKGAVRPVAEDAREEIRQFWSSFGDLDSSGSVPRGMVVGCKVYDPRLTFPPKNAVPKAQHSDVSLTPSSSTFPSSMLAGTEIWDENSRVRPRFQKKDLDDRRSKSLIPGTALRPLQQDDRVPILLIQRSFENSATQNRVRSQGLHGWTLVVPRGWGMPFFSSLTFTGTRVGGQRERHTQLFEASCASFPGDFPSTTAYESHALQLALDEQERWAKKPPAKRPNWDKLGTRSPWRADWEVVLGLQTADEQEFVMTQREQSDNAMDVDKTSRPWLLQGVGSCAIVDHLVKLQEPSAGLVEELNKLRAKRSIPCLDSNTGPDLFRSALVPVHLRMCGRGSPSDMAAIYTMTDDEYAKQLSASTKNEEGQFDLDVDCDGGQSRSKELCEGRPPSESIIGYVTTGNYSLSLGEGLARGALSLSRMVGLRKQAQRLQSSDNVMVKVRDRDSTVYRTAWVEISEK